MINTDSIHKNPVLERETTALKPPSMYQVVMLNDDYTPMEFVVFVLQNFFAKDPEQALAIMLSVHHEGRGVCGIYPHDLALSKIDQVIDCAQQHQHPLQCVLEAV